MKNILFKLSFFAIMASLVGCSESQRNTSATIVTSAGSISVVLYNDTPLHKANFIEMVNAGTYEGMLFHRVIDDFVIQAGDPTSKDAEPGAPLGEASAGEEVTSEITPAHIHRKGVLAAAREGNAENPTRMSSGSHFYFVKGKVYTPEELEEWGAKIVERRENEAKTIDDPHFEHRPFALTEEQIEAYTTVGGTPHLDGEYTIFGEITEGLDVLERIISVETDENDRPLENIVIEKIILLNK